MLKPTLKGKKKAAKFDVALFDDYEWRGDESKNYWVWIYLLLVLLIVLSRRYIL